jgi:membrane fusion protein (multidrug efflux system)
MATAAEPHPRRAIDRYRTTMKTKIAIAIIGVILIVSGLAGVKALQFKTLIAAGKSFSQPPETVSSTIVSEEKWQTTLVAIGSVTAVEGVNVTTEVAGLVRDISFESGAAVEKGAVLVRLDTSSEEAQLRSIQAQLELARINLERERTLRSENMVSQSDLDATEASLKQYQANADGVQAVIDKKTIRAPFAGRLGIRQINLGQYLDSGKPIVSLQSLAPIHADFWLPQQELSRLATGMRVRLYTDAFPDHDFEGQLSAINPDLDASTRSVGLQATFDNREQLLRPGMFARVEVLLPEEKNVLVIPATSVVSAPYGDSVYVIESSPGTGTNKPGLSVRQQFIRTGRARGDFVTVESGLKAGDRIVAAGVFKLRNGMSVVENNELAPKSSETPRPSDS